MSVGIVIWLIGAVIGFVWMLVPLIRVGPNLNLATINMAFWTALGWPFFAIGLALGFALKALIPDKSE